MLRSPLNTKPPCEVLLRFGTGGEKDHATGAIHKIKAVVFYVLDLHDNHTLLVDDGMDMF